jgi:hypothetical protein
MKTIYKYILNVGSIAETEFTFPAVSEIVHFDSVGADLFIWVLQDNDTPKSNKITVRVFATGQEVYGDYSYIGTCKMYDGRLIWHLFEKKGA